MSGFKAGLCSTLSSLVLMGLLTPGSCGIQAAREIGYSDRISELLELGRGVVVADVGAGDGDWTLDFSRRVGERGRVFSTEVDSQKIVKIRSSLEKSKTTNVTLILGSQTDTGLPASCCDAIFLRLVYHHFTDPAAMGKGLARALRPGGRLAVIDFMPENRRSTGDRPGNRGGHGIRPERVVEELSQAGFEISERIDRWDGDEDRYCLLFRLSPTRETPAIPRPELE